MKPRGGAHSLVFFLGQFALLHRTHAARGLHSSFRVFPLVAFNWNEAPHRFAAGDHSNRLSRRSWHLALHLLLLGGLMLIGPAIVFAEWNPRAQRA